MTRTEEIFMMPGRWGGDWRWLEVTGQMLPQVTRTRAQHSTLCLNLISKANTQVWQSHGVFVTVWCTVCNLHTLDTVLSWKVLTLRDYTDSLSDKEQTDREQTDKEQRWCSWWLLWGECSCHDLLSPEISFLGSCSYQHHDLLSPVLCWIVD